VPVTHGRSAALSLHLRDLSSLRRLVRTHPRLAWLWFPRHPEWNPVFRAWAKILNLRIVAECAEPGPGEVWIAPRLGLVRDRLPGCESAWVSPGHDFEEPLRLGVPRLMDSTRLDQRQDGSDTPTPEATRAEIAAWIKESMSENG